MSSRRRLRGAVARRARDVAFCARARALEPAASVADDDGRRQRTRASASTSARVCANLPPPLDTSLLLLPLAAVALISWRFVLPEMRARKRRISSVVTNRNAQFSFMHFIKLNIDTTSSFPLSLFNLAK